MVDIQSPTAEIRRGKKIESKIEGKKPQGKNIMSASATQGDHNNRTYPDRCMRRVGSTSDARLTVRQLWPIHNRRAMRCDCVSLGAIPMILV